MWLDDQYMTLYVCLHLSLCVCWLFLFCDAIWDFSRIFHILSGYYKADVTVLSQSGFMSLHQMPSGFWVGRRTDKIGFRLYKRINWDTIAHCYFCYHFVHVHMLHWRATGLGVINGAFCLQLVEKFLHDLNKLCTNSSSLIYHYNHHYVLLFLLGFWLFICSVFFLLSPHCAHFLSTPALHQLR